MTQHTSTLVQLTILIAATLLMAPLEAQSQAWKVDTTLPAPDEYVGVVREPEVIHCQDPDYPAKSKEAGHYGLVIVKALIDAKGEVRDATLARSSGYPLLDQAAMNAAYKCEWKPAISFLMSYPVAYWVRYPVRFELEDSTPETQDKTRSLAILLVKEKDLTSREALPEGEIRIWGGFNDGLDTGMTGTIVRENYSYGDVSVADLRVPSVPI